MSRRRKKVYFSPDFTDCIGLWLWQHIKERTGKTEAEQKEKLVIWSYYETQAQRSGLDELVKNFNQSQNQYEAEWEYVPMTGFVKGCPLLTQRINFRIWRFLITRTLRH